MNEKIKQALALALAFFVGYAPVTWASYRFTDDSNNEVATMDNSGNMTATSFSGDGSGLTSLPAGTPADGSVTSAKLAANSVDSEKYVDNSIEAAHLNFNYAGSSGEGGAATTALALNADPTDCSGDGQYAKGIGADGTAACDTIDDLDVPNSITIDNLSGTNTGDQTITLTGDVTGSGTGSFAATIAAGAVTSPKLAADSVDSEKIVDGAVGPDALAATSVAAASYGSASQSLSITFDADGRATAASAQSISITESQVSDLSHTVDTDTWADLLQLTNTAATICAATPSATPKLALGTDSFDLYSATGTAIGQWRNTRTGAGACQ